MIKDIPLAKNLRLLNELVGVRLKIRMLISCIFIVLLSIFDFFVLTLIYQLVNTLLQSQESTFSKIAILKALESVSPLMLLTLITLTVGVKSFAQYLNSLAINSIIAKRESFVSASLFKATLEEKIDARKNRESVESLILYDSYVVRVFSIVKSFPTFVSNFTTILAIFAGLLFYNASSSLILIFILSGISSVTYTIYSKIQKSMSSKLIGDERGLNTLKIESQRLATELVLGNRVDDTIFELEKFYTSYKTTMGKITINGELPRYILEFTLVASLTLTYFFNHSESFLSVLALLAAAAFRVVPVIGSFVSNLIGLSVGMATLTALSNIVPTLKALDLDLTNTSSKDYLTVPFYGDINLNKVDLQYKGANHKLFENLNITLKNSTTTVFMGASGAGKSTLLHLIVGILEPTAGEIYLFDGTTKTRMGDSVIGISFLQQGVPLLSGSVAENIAGSTLKEYSAERVKAAVRDSGLEATISKFEDGIDYQVGEDAKLFSAGERQRLGLARALYLEPRLLILDEPTSNLDSETETEIWRTLATLRGKMTIIIVSHRGVPKDVYDRELIFTKQGNLTVISG
jgi:ABC-type multidrug transport system fused ATPase/permease subunit